MTGSIDESIRHSITKLAHLHFAASEDAANRIIKLGERPETVFNVGGSSLDVLASLDLDDLKPSWLIKSLGVGLIIDLKPNEFLTVIQHPVTTEYHKTSYSGDYKGSNTARYSNYLDNAKHGRWC